LVGAWFVINGAMPYTVRIAPFGRVLIFLSHERKKNRAKKKVRRRMFQRLKIKKYGLKAKNALGFASLERIRFFNVHIF
jgi:hypothetical protein